MSDTQLQVRVKNYMRTHVCCDCSALSKRRGCVYTANSDEYMCSKVPLHLKILLNNEE